MPCDWGKKHPQIKLWKRVPWVGLDEHSLYLFLLCSSSPKRLKSDDKFIYHPF